MPVEITVQTVGGKCDICLRGETFHVPFDKIRDFAFLGDIERMNCRTGFDFTTERITLLIERLDLQVETETEAKRLVSQIMDLEYKYP